MKIDAVVLTKNSGESLDQCLQALYNSVPVNRLIAVDGYSTDNTIEILCRYDTRYGNVVIVQDPGNRGLARQRAIELVSTEWFIFVDSDAILCDRWFEKAKRFIDPRVGAIWGIELWSVIKNPFVLRLFKKVTMKIFESRGGTHDLLVRHKAVDGIRIPQKLHSFEDAFIKEYITGRGYRVIPTYDPYCIHIRARKVWSVRAGIEIAATEFTCGLLSRYINLLPSYGFYVPYFVYQIVNQLKGRSGEGAARKKKNLG